MSEPYRRPFSTTWWLKNSHYKLYMCRELTAVFVGIFLIIFLVFLIRLAQGPEAYSSFVASLSSPVSFLFHILAFIAACYHSITWFNLTPKVAVIRRGEERLPDALVIAPNYVGWATISIIILVIATWS
ncbi:MAG: fumarate reductase subunit C [Candidatus Binatia bacterium]